MPLSSLTAGRAANLLDALAHVGRAAAQAARRGERTVLFFYYSGHAKDSALRLGETRLDIESVKRLIATMPVDVRVAILDSCKSGAFTPE